MLKCESLNKVLTGDKSVNYTCFKNDLIEFVKNYMIEINENTYNYIPIVNTMNSSIDRATSTDADEIEIDEKVLKYIYSGKKIYLLVIFHELSHIKQNYLISIGEINKNLSDIIKDDLLNSYFTSINKRFKEYYEINYNYISSEIQADIESIDLFYTYVNENNIKLNIFDLYNLSELNKNLRKRVRNKNRKFSNSRFRFYKTMDFYKLFDYTIKKNPEWLETYPQLKLEYYFDEVVKRRDYKNFDLEIIENESDGYKEYVKYLKKEANKKTLFKMLRG